VQEVSDTLHIFSYAKLNYTLDILSRRPDGYHNLASVMQVVSLADEIELTHSPQPGVTLECDMPGIPTDENNLAYRAASLVLRAANSNAGIHIALRKRIPPQAGLGGGSSNAAYILRGVNAWLGLGLSEEQLHPLAKTLGSDVPFFLVGGTAVVRGRGEWVRPLPDGPPLWFVVVKPPENISTAWAYAALDALPERISARATRSMEEILQSGSIERVVARMTNDFEQVVLAEHLPIALLHDDLLMARARNARLCGSGSAVFGVALSEAEAQSIARLMRRKYSEVYVCRALTRAESFLLQEGSV
jgi:4-diphosphocytidyl-2-C-methyl-D-erythritol kinase